LILAENWKFAGIAEVGSGGNQLALPPGLLCAEKRKKEEKERKKQRLTLFN